MKRVAVAVLALIFSLVLFEAGAEASWLIDAKKFHISAHGQLSCRDCHESLFGSAFHPDPSKVNDARETFFKPDLCLSCHDDIKGDLDRGLHGAKKISHPEKYRYCLRCHKSHYQPRLDGDKIGSFAPGKPRSEQCGACHAPKSALPKMSAEDEACMACHRLEQDSPKAERVSSLCFHCHGDSGTEARKMTGKLIPLMDAGAYQKTTHAALACAICHPDSTRFRHAGQRLGDCRQCHPPHDEKTAHDAHVGVACEACHLENVKPFKDPETQQILWRQTASPGGTLKIHQMVLGRDQSTCKRCHFNGNAVGASAMVLPAKGVFCMPCHAATFSVGDTATILALIAFLTGFSLIAAYWLSGALPEEMEAWSAKKILRLIWKAVRAIFSLKLARIVKALFLDVLLQRRLYRQSRPRWLIHSLIFLPFVFRFLWGLTALIGSLWAPQWPIRFMLDKNNPATAFLFDLTGIMILAGVCLALGRGLFKDLERLPGLPRQDRPALGLIAGLVFVGFILEGMRIAMTGWPGGSAYAFLGYGISLLFSPFSGLSQVYGYLWYVHAILTAAFIAYLPFSRLVHVIMAPVVLAMNAASEHEH